MFDFSQYFADIAVRLKDIAHTDKKPKFHRVSGLANLEELLQNLIRTTSDGYQLVIEDNLDSRFLAYGATLLDEQYYVFYVLKKGKLNDFAAIEQVKDGAKAISKKIWSKMFRDYEADWKMQTANANGLRGFSKASITYQTVGPLADQYWGVMCSFTTSDNPGIKYNPDDWTT